MKKGVEGQVGIRRATLESNTGTGIALNITRTRVTVLVFNLTIISLLLSMIVARGGTTGEQHVIAHLTSYAALFVGFCLTLLGIFWLLFSQNLDAQGLSRPWPFTLGSITTFLALSQTVTAFMHEYLVEFESVVAAMRPIGADQTQGLARLDVLKLDALGHTPLFILLVMGGAIWFLITYMAPLSTVIRSPVRGGRRWVFAAYYFAIQVPLYWVYASAWRLQYVSADQPTDMLSLFGLQFVQPLLWFR
jgi:hypothetical protein